MNQFWPQQKFSVFYTLQHSVGSTTHFHSKLKKSVRKKLTYQIGVALWYSIIDSSTVTYYYILYKSKHTCRSPGGLWWTWCRWKHRSNHGNPEWNNNLGDKAAQIYTTIWTCHGPSSLLLVLPHIAKKTVIQILFTFYHYLHWKLCSALCFCVFPAENIDSWRVPCIWYQDVTYRKLN